MYLLSFPRKLVKAHISTTFRVFAEYKSDVSYYQVTLSPKLFSHFSIFENSSGKMQDFVISIASLTFTEGKLKACKHSRHRLNCFVVALVLLMLLFFICQYPPK